MWTGLLQFGSSLLCSMIQQGEHILKNTSPVDLDNQMQTAWFVYIADNNSSLIPIDVIKGHYIRLLGS